MANSINPIRYEDFVTRRWLIIMSRATLAVLEKRVMDMVRVLYMNPSKCFSRKNNKNYIKGETIKMLDNTLEELGVNYQREYYLIKTALASDKIKSCNLHKYLL